MHSHFAEVLQQPDPYEQAFLDTYSYRRQDSSTHYPSSHNQAVMGLFFSSHSNFHIFHHVGSVVSGALQWNQVIVSTINLK